MPPVKVSRNKAHVHSTSVKKLKKSDLVQLVIELHGRHDDIDQIIARHTALGSAAEKNLFTVIERQLQQVAKDSFFIDYYDGSNYAARLECLLIDINTLLREQSPVQALEATETFIWLHESARKARAQTFILAAGRLPKQACLNCFQRESPNITKYHQATQKLK